MYFTSGSDRAFEQLMQTRPGADHFDNGEAGAPEDCGTCRFYRPHWKYQFCVYEECPYQPGKRTALDGAVKFQVKGVDDEMAVFRVEKNRGYTVMSNHHLRNKDLSLKAKGLLSQMLSLPEDWDFTLKGLSLINREQIDAIRAAIRELEQAGYIVRSRERDSQGRLRGADYVIYEQPQPVPDSPTLENPMLDNPTQEKPTLGKPTQLNKDISSKEKSITDGSNTDSIPILFPPSPLGEEAAAPPERKGTGAKPQSAVEIYREIIKDNIEYEHLCQYAKGIDRDMLDEIVDLLVETVCSARKTIRIAGDDYPAELVKSKLMKLNSSHIEFVFDCISKNTTEICARSFEEAAQYTIDLFGLQETVEGIIEEWNNMAVEEYSNHVGLLPHALDYLLRLKEHGIKLAVATGLPEKLYIPCLKNNSILELFDALCSTDEVQRGKEYSDVFELAARKLGVAPEHCIVFDDVLPAIKSAKAARMLAGGIYDKYSADQRTEIERIADIYLLDFRQAPIPHKEV